MERFSIRPDTMQIFKEGLFQAANIALQKQTIKKKMTGLSFCRLVRLECVHDINVHVPPRW